MKPASLHNPKLAETLVLDELFDLSLYKALRAVTSPDVHHTLDELITVETGHLAFWQKLFDLSLDQLNFGRRVKLSLMIFVCKLFGSTAVHLVLEAIEVHGARRGVWLAFQRLLRCRPFSPGGYDPVPEPDTVQSAKRVWP